MTRTARALRWVMPAALLAVATATGILTMLGVEWNIGVAENRTPTALPRPSPAVLLSRSSFVQVNDWASDTVTTKPAAVLAINSLRLYGFRAAGAPDVLVGRDGWFYWGQPSMIRAFEGSPDGLPDDAYLRDFAQWLRRMTAWADRTGIRVLLAIPPNKQTLYPEYMPKRLSKHSGSPGVQILEQLTAAEAPSMSVKLFDDLLRAKGVEQVYYKIDTHWNRIGGLHGAAAIVRALEDSPAGDRLAPAPAWTYRTVELSPGNFGQLLGIVLVESAQAPVPDQTAEIIRVPLTEAESRLVPAGARRVRAYVNPATPGAPTLVLLGDSFRSALERPLASRFGKLYSFNLWYTPNTPENRFPCRLLGSIKPAVVVIEMVERRVRRCGADDDCRYYFDPAASGGFADCMPAPSDAQAALGVPPDLPGTVP